MVLFTLARIAQMTRTPERHTDAPRPGQDIIVEPMKAYLTQVKESQRWRSNTWCCKRRRRVVRLPA
jgi:hypothetical protein